MFDLFCSAGRDWGVFVEGKAGPSRVEASVVAREQGEMTLANGVRIQARASIRARDRFDVVCVPELAIAPNEVLEGRYLPELAWLRRQHAAGAMIATACSGAVLAAEAGLLDGCEATTHWAYCETLRARYPKITVCPERALVVSGEGQSLIMAGGGTTWLDLALYLIARLVDLETAMQTARVNVIDWHAVGQQPFARLAQTRQVDDAAIAKSQAWIARQYAVTAPVASMVRLSGLAERTFKRRFQAATGMAPLAYVHALRLEEAKHRLETTAAPIERIAQDVGYEDAAFFARLFRRSVRLTPAQYRRKFAGLRQTLAKQVGA
ncbi:MAG TPA: helix-turn-helix domain-containing protein [Polyangiales bacterium]|nr:helix-turn-helix domain-containing protein [Polyangiales bacterium]